MLNILIATKNLQNSQNLLNYISQEIAEARIGYVTTDGKEAIELLNKFHFNLAIIDTDLPGADVFTLLKKLSSIKEKSYAKSLIFLSSNSSIAQNLKRHPLVHSTYDNENTYAELIVSIKNTIKEQKNNNQEMLLKLKITKELQKVGFNLSHKGTHYLSETIYLISTKQGYAENLTRTIYPKISKSYNKNLNNIKCNITSATDAACRNIDEYILDKYFKLSAPIKLTTKMIIYSVLQKL